MIGRRHVGRLIAFGFATTFGLVATAPLAWADKPTAGSSAATHSSSTKDGTQNQPQPYSGADSNGNGANPGATSSPNPYKSTRDGSASLNGSGTGQSTGKPCAGCVGKADNKNPPGQQANGSDANAGYECDTNHGIGRSNPAHTGCATTTTVPPGTGSGPGTPPSNGGTPVVTQSGSKGPSIPVTSRSADAPLLGAASPALGVTAQPSSSRLAFTGSNTSALIMFGVGIAVLGLIIVAMTKIGSRGASASRRGVTA